MTDKESKGGINVGIATLLVLAVEIKKIKSVREFAYFVTNESHRLVQYQTAILWEVNELNQVRLVTQSGVAKLDLDAASNIAIKNLVEEILQTSDAATIHNVNVPESGEATFPASRLLWCPLLNDNNEITGGILLFRDVRFSDDEMKMLNWLISEYQFVWQGITRKRIKINWHALREKPNLVVFGIVIFVVMIFPVRLSTIGDGTVVPLDPLHINAPFEGVIESFAVDPGEHVKPDQLLFTYDKTELKSSVDVTQKELQVTKAKLRTASSAGLDTPEANADIPVLQSQIEIDQAKLDYYNELLAKAEVKSSAAGIAVFDSKDDWVGQPVRTGEQILVVADPNQVELKIDLPVNNSVQLEVGSDGLFYMYGVFNPMPVKLKVLGYNARMLPNKVLAYQLIAQFTDKNDKPQLGSQGIVRLYGHRVPLFYYLIRKPLMIFRETTGL